ncbi:MAG: PP2C family protein-serine/threonine phosphatase [Calditrichota bacterium]
MYKPQSFGPTLSELDRHLRQLSELSGDLIQSLQQGNADHELIEQFLMLWRETVRGDAVLEMFREVERERQENQTLIDISMKLSSSSAIEDVLRTILDSMRQVVDFNAAGIFIYNRDMGQLEIDMLVGYEGAERELIYKKFQQGVKLGQGIVGNVIQRGVPHYAPDVRTDEYFIPARDGTLSELAVPILARGEVIGALSLEADRLDAFTERDQRTLTTVANHAGVALERARDDRLKQHTRRMQEEIALARRIQLSFLPRKMPNFEPFDIAGVNFPSSEIGGDYFDFIPITRTDLGVAIGDATGHGVGAALLMANFRACLRIESRSNFAIRTILRKVNDYLFETNLPESYVTAVYGVLDRQNHIFSYANAGHNPPILFRSNGDVERLEVGGLILGAFPHVGFDETAVRMERGDVLVLYTDGVTEARDAGGTEFGVQRLISLIEDFKDHTAQEIVNRVTQHVRDYRSLTDEAQDDLTVSIIKYA